MFVNVKVTTGSRKEAVSVLGEHRLVIAVKEEPERNEANRRVMQLVAAAYGVSPARVRLVKGHHRPSKVLSIT